MYNFEAKSLNIEDILNSFAQQQNVKNKLYVYIIIKNYANFNKLFLK